MERLDTFKYRKHPGGLRSKMMIFFKAILIISIVVLSVKLVWTLTGMASNDLYLNVKTPRASELPGELRTVKLLKPALHGQYEFRSRNIFDWFLANHRGSSNIIPLIFYILITWYALRLSFSINAEQPFSFKVEKYIRKIGWLFIAAFIVEAGRALYLVFSGILPKGPHLRLDTKDFGEFSFFTGIIMLIIADVYHRGCILKEDQELTI